VRPKNWQLARKLDAAHAELSADQFKAVGFAGRSWPDFPQRIVRTIEARHEMRERGALDLGVNDPCVTLSVNGLNPLAALELSRIAASGWV
jgi:hypothetical protein